MPKPVVNPGLAKRLRACIAAIPGMTVRKLAREVGMTQQGLDEIVQGHVLRPKRLREIAVALQTTQERLLGDTRLGSVLVSANIVEIALINWVNAGNPADAPFESQDQIKLLFAGLGRGEFFATRVEGDSMNRVSPDGSIIVVNQSDIKLVSGRFYIFSIKGEPTYKIWQEGNPPFLKPYSTNPAHNPIIVHRRELVVIGRVCRSVLDL